MGRALIVVDVQNDFCEGGSLAVEGGAAVAAGVASFIQDHPDRYDQIVYTADWHPDNWLDLDFSHFADVTSGDEPNYNTTWPVHCVESTPGAAIHPALAPTLAEQADQVFFKGQTTAAYSGFEGTAQERDDKGLGLAEYLHREKITGVDVVGIATDYCVKATALDAVKNGFKVSVFVDLCAAVAEETKQSAYTEMLDAGCYLGLSTHA